MNSKTTKMIMVCQTKGQPCDNKAFDPETKGMDFIFCCQKGFEQSIEDFTKQVKQEKP
jgi:hypothetical protein